MEKYKNNLNPVKEMEEKHTKEILGENKVNWKKKSSVVEKFENKKSFFLIKYGLLCQTKCDLFKSH